MLRRGLRWFSSPQVAAAASNPMNDRRPNTTPSPTPDTPLGDELTRNTLVVFPVPAVAMARIPRARKMTTSKASSVRSRLTEALMLPERKAAHDGHGGETEEPPGDRDAESRQDVVVAKRAECREQAGREHGVPDPEQPAGEEPRRGPEPL